MKRLVIILSVLGIVSCSTVNEDAIIKPQKEKLNINVTSKIKTLYTPAISDISSMQVASQIYEGLVKFNPFDLKIIPAIAESWEINEDMTEYTFKLRKDVYFHNNKCFLKGEGRNVTANDVKYSFTQLCSQQFTNKNFISTLSKVKGALEYYNMSKEGDPTIDIEGLQVIDDFTFKIVLIKPTPFLLNSLALPFASVFPKEAIEEYGEKTFVGTGPYYIEKSPAEQPIILLKNIDYYKLGKNGDRLPYIDTISIGIEKSVLSDMKDFENGKLNIIMSIPEAYISEFMEKNIAKFEKNPPEYTITKYSENSSSVMYNLYNSDIKNFFTNDMNFLDLSLVYFEDLSIKTDTIQE